MHSLRAENEFYGCRERAHPFRQSGNQIDHGFGYTERMENASIRSVFLAFRFCVL